MDHMEKVKSVLDLIQPFSRHAPLNNVGRKIEFEKHSGVDEPYIFQAFVNRISTYRPEFWASAPNAAVCLARYGFVSVTERKIECCGCKMKADLENNLGRQEIEVLAMMSHKIKCKWRFVPTPKAYFKIPSVPGKIYEDLKIAWKDLISLGSRIPRVPNSTLDTTRNMSDFVASVLNSFGSDIGDIQSSAVLLGLCGWVKRSHSSIQCNFCQRSCATWNFFAVQDDGWTILATDKIPRETNKENGNNNISQTDVRREDEKYDSEPVHNSQQNANNAAASDEIESCVRCLSEEEDIQSLHSSDSEETVKYSPLHSNYVLNECCENDSLGSEDGGSIYSEESCHYVSSGDSDDPNASPVLRTKRRRISGPISFQTKKNEDSNFPTGNEAMREVCRSKTNLDEEWPVSSEEEPYSESEVLYDYEENEREINYPEYTDTEYEKYEEYLNSEKPQGEGKTNVIENAYYDNESNNENEQCLVNITDNNFGSDKRENGTTNKEYTHVAMTGRKSDILNYKSEWIKNIPNLENVSEKPMNDEENELTICPAIKLPDPTQNTAAHYELILLNPQEQFSSNCEKHSESTINDFPKIVSTMTLQNPVLNNNAKFSPRKEESCEISHVSGKSTSLECYSSIDADSSGTDSQDIVYMQVSEEYPQESIQREESIRILDREHVEVLECLSPMHNCSLSLTDPKTEAEEQQILTHDALEKREKNEEGNLSQKVNDVYFVLLRKEEIFENKEQKTSNSDLRDDFNDEDLQEIYKIEDGTELVICENEFSSDPNQQHIDISAERMNQNELCNENCQQEVLDFRESSSQKNKKEIFIAKLTDKNETTEHMSPEETNAECRDQPESEMKSDEYQEKNETSKRSDIQFSECAISNTNVIPVKNILLVSNARTYKCIDTTSDCDNTSIVEVFDQQRSIDDTDLINSESDEITQDETSVVYIVDNVNTSKPISEDAPSGIADNASQSMSPVFNTCSKENLIYMNKNQETKDSAANIHTEIKMPHNFQAIHVSLSVNSVAEPENQPEKSLHNISKYIPNKGNSSRNDADIIPCVSTSDSEIIFHNSNKIIQVPKLRSSNTDGSNVSKNSLLLNYQEEEMSVPQFAITTEKDGENVEESRKMSDEEEQIAVSVFRDMKRTHEDTQSTGEPTESSPKVFKFDVEKSFFNPELEHRFWCIWRMREYQNTPDQPEYKNVAKKSWECALESVLESLKDLEEEKIISKFENYMQCLNTVGKWKLSK